MKTKITLSLLSALLISGCSFKDMNPSPSAISLEETERKMNHGYELRLSIRKGEHLSDIVEQLKASMPNRIFVDKTKEDLEFFEDASNLSPDEFRQYLQLKYNRDVMIRKFSEKIYLVEENEVKVKKISKEEVFEIPNLNFEVKGDFTYEEIFNLLREQNINIFVDNQAKNKFKYTDLAPKFNGDLKNFIKLVSTKEKLHVVLEKDSIKFKDVKTVTYNLHMPQINLSPALTPNGSSTAVTITSAIGEGTAQNTTAGAGGIAPLEDIDKQLKVMLKDAIFDVNLGSGTLSVTGDYDAIHVADKIVDDFHEIYGKAVKMEVNIYKVTLSDSHAFGIDYQFLKNELVGDTIQSKIDFNTGLTGNLGATAGSLSLTGRSGSLSTTTAGVADPLGGATTPIVAVAAAETQGLIFKYLNQFGRASIVTKPTLGTVNNLPVKLDIVDSKDYVYSLNQQSTPGMTSSVGISSASTTVNPEIKTVTTGYSLVLHPKIEDDYIKIAMKTISSTLNGLVPYEYESSTDAEGEPIMNKIYLKDVSAREFDETVKIKEGEIAIVGGYMYEEKTSNKSGLPLTSAEDSDFDALTSSKSKNIEKVEIVITISAKVI